MGKAGSPICRYIDCKCYIWLNSEEQEECIATNIIFILLSMRKLLTRSVRPTQREQTIVHIRLQAEVLEQARQLERRLAYPAR